MTKIFRDITYRVAGSYVAALPDARPNGDGYVGDGWEAQLRELPPVQVGSLEFRQVQLTLEGTPERVEEVWEQLSPKFLRGGA